jgi:hypothetical protein
MGNSNSSGCGCLIAIILSGLVCFWMYQEYKDADESRARRAAEEAAKTPEQRERERIAAIVSKPDMMLVDMQFAEGLRRYLNNPDSYKPTKTTKCYQPEYGYAWMHEFRAKNGFGAYIKDACGLTYNTNINAKTRWTFYAPDQMNSFAAQIVLPK